MRVSDTTIYRVLKRHGVSRLPGKVGSRKVHTKRYHKQMPDHHIQMDVKPLIFNNKAAKKLKRYQYPAIDDAMRVRALKIYDRHTQKSAIAFVGHVIAKYPFRIQQIRTNRGHEFQAQFHWHVEDGVSDMLISNPERLSSTARSDGPSAWIRKSAISC